MDKDSREKIVPNGRGCLVIAGWTLHEARHRLEQGDQSVKLEPKTTELLGYLARHAGEPLSREELLREVWSEVVVSDEALTNAVNKIRRAFGDDRQNPEVIETIPKMGYRLIASVDQPASVEHEENDTPADASIPAGSRDEPCVGGQVASSVPTSGIQHRTLVLVIGVFLMVGFLLSVSFYLWGPPSTDFKSTAEHRLPANPGKPSLAVLPFANPSDDSQQEYFVDGITEDLITDLSKVSGLNVIARNSVFAYKDMAPKPQDVALQMGASHILEGSVRKAADQVRINVKLIDASSGLNLWAERFDGSLEDVFKLQDHVTRRVAAALAIKLTEREQDTLARDRTTNVEALQHYFIGRAYYSASKQENEASRKMFRRAIDLDPGYGQAYAALALTYLDDWRRGWSENPEQAINTAMALAQQAISVDDTIPEAHFALGFIYLYAKGQHDRAIAEAKTALALNPNHASGYTLLASAYFFAGFPEKALPLDRKAIQLDPGSSFLYHVHLGRSYYFQGRYQEALDEFKRAEERNYNYIPNHLWLAATYSQLGQLEDAAWEADQVLTLDPDFSIQRWMTQRPYKNLTHREQLLDGLRKAGFPH